MERIADKKEREGINVSIEDRRKRHEQKLYHSLRTTEETTKKHSFL
jgi:hypothetical protein